MSDARHPRPPDRVRCWKQPHPATRTLELSAYYHPSHFIHAVDEAASIQSSASPSTP